MESTTIITPRYNEVDQMGYVYHGNYAAYFHVARTNFLRKHQLNDNIIEEKGYLLPVINLNINYLKPAHYDSPITIHARMQESPELKIKFNYIVTNINNDIICKAESTNVVVEKDSRKPVRVPKFIKDKLTSEISN